ncbi:hypothetical protein I6F07_10420 [Ensifer sp. IC4062]|nr:hypothetical protein [Ensifer sp. IC4062]MCA1440627.1 hypothetical protein [Ensifer sp. IC4062]
MSSVPIGVIGKIVAGVELGRYVKVVDDAESTGGFLILTADDAEFQKGFDNWVEDAAALQRYFREAGWLIEWNN